MVFSANNHNGVPRFPEPVGRLSWRSDNTTHTYPSHSVAPGNTPTVNFYEAPNPAPDGERLSRATTFDVEDRYVSPGQAAEPATNRPGLLARAKKYTGKTIAFPFKVVGGALKAIANNPGKSFLTILAASIAVPSGLHIARKQRCKNDFAPEGAIAVIQGGDITSNSYCPVWLKDNGHVTGGFNQLWTGQENNKYRGNLEKGGNGFTPADRPFGMVRDQEDNGDFRIYRHRRLGYESAIVNSEGRVRSVASKGYKKDPEGGKNTHRIIPLEGFDLTDKTTYAEIKALYDALPKEERPEVKDKHIAALALHR